MSIKYLVKLFARSYWPPERATAYIGLDGVYVFYGGAYPENSYWIDWGGTYDTPTTVDVSLLFESQLVKLETFSEMLDSENSFFTDPATNQVFFNLPRPPWQYSSSLTELGVSRGFQSSVRDEVNAPSDDTYINAQGVSVRFPSRLVIPKNVNNKLSDPISGSALLPTFSFTLENSDGALDDIRDLNYENVIAELLRTNKSVPDLSDFKVIRRGLIDYLDVDARSFKATTAEYIRTFTASATRKFSASLFPDAPDGTIDRDIPIGYGELLRVRLFNVGTNKWVGIDPDYLESVDEVYDREGNTVSFSVDDGIITATGAAFADITGKDENRIGEIITSEIESKVGMTYNNTNWDQADAGAYIANSARVNFYFSGGSVRDLITNALKSDSAFFITKNDGRLTLRRYGRAYRTHNIDSWQIMEIPKKSTNEAKRLYSSTVSIRYEKRHDTREYNKEYSNDTRENELRQIYRKSKESAFDVDLTALEDVENLSNLLLTRFGIIRELLTIKLAYDTSEVNPLDTVNLPVVINDREFSKTNQWLVREVNPAQDTLVLEELNIELEQLAVATVYGDGVYLDAVYGG